MLAPNPRIRIRIRIRRNQPEPTILRSRGATHGHTVVVVLPFTTLTHISFKVAPSMHGGRRPPAMIPVAR